jgi:hypothetical protein
MDQTLTLPPHDRRRAVDRLAEFIAQSVEAARAVEAPFYHLEFDRVFPDDIYGLILALMPESSDYRPMHGRSKGHDLTDGTHTRAKIDLFPEYIRKIPPHTDTRWKGITVQLYLPADDANTDIGTIFHEKLADGSMPKKAQMRFAPNTGYAFAVGSDTWHSAATVHNRVKTRDSILLTYFVDQGLLKVTRNRGKRLGNFFRNEIRQRT